MSFYFFISLVILLNVAVLVGSHMTGNVPSNIDAEILKTVWAASLSCVIIYFALNLVLFVTTGRSLLTA